MAVSRSLHLLDTARRRTRGGIAELDLDDIREARGPYVRQDLPVVGGLVRRLGLAVTGTPAADVRVEQVTVPGAGGDLVAHRYVPQVLAPSRPLVLHLHGGGWVVGAPVQYAWWCSHVAADLGAVVVSVDYRKAPEHPAPAAAEDAAAVLTWLLGEGGDAMGADGPVAVGGDSAGGNLAALAAIAVRDAGLDGLAAQLLVYPATDLTMTSDSATTITHEPILWREDMESFVDRYLAGGVAADDPRVSPLHVEDLAGLAPAIVQTAEFDPLRDEGRAYADRLVAAGVTVRHTEYADVPHGFASLPGLAPVARQALAEIVQFARPLLTTA